MYVYTCNAIHFGDECIFSPNLGIAVGAGSIGYASPEEHVLYGWVYAGTKAIFEQRRIVLHERVRGIRFGKARRPGICGTQVKSSSNKNWMSPSRRLDGAYFSETPLSWHVRPHFSLIAIMNY
jgi:hypothetical protein